ncbi:MAG: hypothetical protein ABIK80_04270, partial [candidate division WOR-3 bacterium]
MRKNYFLILFSLFIFGLSFSQVHDVGVLSIITPVDTIREDTTIFPQARITNFGTEGEIFEVLFKITDELGNDVYYKIDTLNLAPNETTDYTFSQSWLAVRGNYAVKCSTMLSGDINNDNDWQDSSLFIIAHDVGVEYIISPVDTI